MDKEKKNAGIDKLDAFLVAFAFLAFPIPSSPPKNEMK
jgi:hypothetical protein